MFSPRSFTGFFFKKRFDLFIHERHRERQRERERGRDTGRGGADSMQGARHWTRSQDSRIMPWAEGKHQTIEPPRDPHFQVLNSSL